MTYYGRAKHRPRVSGPRVTGPRVTGLRVTGARVSGPQVTGLGGIFSVVKDPEAMRAWYRDTLGIEPLRTAIRLGR